MFVLHRRNSLHHARQILSSDIGNHAFTALQKHTFCFPENFSSSEPRKLTPGSVCNRERSVAVNHSITQEKAVGDEKLLTLPGAVQLN